MNNQKGFAPIAVIFAIVIILAVGGGMYYLGGKNKEGAAVPQEEVVTEQVAFTEQQGTQNSTTNWKTYRNEKYGFEVRYPETWGIKEEQEGSYVSFGLAPYYFGRFIKVSCETSEGGTNTIGKGSDIDLAISGNKVRVAGVDAPVRTPGEEGESFGFRVVAHCEPVKGAVEKNCVSFQGWNTPIDEIDKQFIESIRFFKGSESLQCAKG